MRDVLIALVGGLAGSVLTLLIQRTLGKRDATETEARKALLVVADGGLDGSPDEYGVHPVDVATLTNGSGFSLRGVNVRLTQESGKWTEHTMDALKPGAECSAESVSEPGPPVAVATFTIHEIRWQLDHVGKLTRC